jgi:hypothetical protein
MIHSFDIAPVPLDIEKYQHFVHIFRAVAVNGGHSHPNIERSGLVRVIACAPVAGIATSRVSLLRRFYSSFSYCQSVPDSESDRAELDSESPRQLDRDPGSDPELERHSMSLSKYSQCFTQFVCCNCYERGADKIHCTFFSNKRAAAQHITRSAMCRDAGKGVNTVTQEYRPSKRVEDQEAGTIGRAGTWPVRPAAPGMTYCTQNRPNL